MEFGVLGFEEGGKLEKTPSDQGREPAIISTHMWRQVGESNPGHSGGGRKFPLYCVIPALTNAPSLLPAWKGSIFFTEKKKITDRGSHVKLISSAGCELSATRYLYLAGDPTNRNWVRAEVNLDSYSKFRVGLEGIVGGDDKTDIALDDISFSAGCYVVCIVVL